MLPLLTRVLGPVEYGHVVSFTLLVTLCLTVAGLNAHAALGVVWFQRPHAEIPAFTGTALAIVIVSTLLVAPLVAGAIWPVTPTCSRKASPPSKLLSPPNSRTRM